MVGSTTPTAMCEGGCTVAISSFMVAYKDGKAASTIGIGYYTGGTCTAPPTSPNPDGGGGGGDGGGTGGTGGDGGGGTGGTGGGTGGTGGGTGGTGGGTGGGGGDKPPVKCPNGDCTGTDGNGPSDGTDPASDGECPPGTYKSGGKCYPNKQPEPPDQDGKCPPGYAKVGTDCVPYKAEDEEDKDDKPSVFGGSCGGFTCDGDAIQCAIAREQHIRACKLFDDESDESRLYKEHKGKTGNQTGDLPGNETISITGRIDTSDAIGGGGCFGDLSITVWGAAVSLPLSNLCTYLAMLGNILVAVSMLMAARIITRG